MLNTNKQEHIKPVLIQLHWLPVEFRIQYKILLMAFKCINDTAPDCFKDLIHQFIPNHSLRSKNYLTHEQYHLKSYGVILFSVAASILWTGLETIQNFLLNFVLFCCRTNVWMPRVKIKNFGWAANCNQPQHRLKFVIKNIYIHIYK